MGFKSDYEEMTSSFEKMGVLGKLFIGVSFFITVSSVTSLSEVVFKWKGFILEALKAYQKYFVETLKEYGLQIGLNYQDYEIHSAVILTTVFVLGMRLLMLGQKIAFDEINKLYNGDLKPKLLFFKLNIIFFPLLIWLGYGFSEMVFNLSCHLFLALIYPVFLVVPKVLMCWMSDSNSCYLERHRFNYFKFYYSYMLAVFIFVGILAAINLGLTKVA